MGPGVTVSKDSIARREYQEYTDNKDYKGYREYTDNDKFEGYTEYESDTKEKEP